MFYGDRLRKLRKETGYTITEFGEMWGKPFSTYAAYEQGYRKPPIEFLIQLADYYNTTIDYLLCYTDNPQSDKEKSDFKTMVNTGNLHWDGVPLTEKELKHVKDLLEIVVRDRMPEKNKSRHIV